MPELRDVCHARSKNAGPFWITLDLFFPDAESFERYVNASPLQAVSIGALYGVAADLVRRFEVPELRALKITYPRHHPQGGRTERDMHGGQQYVRLLDVWL